MRSIVILSLVLVLTVSGSVAAQVDLHLQPFGTPLYGGRLYSMCQVGESTILATAGTGLYRTTNSGQEWEVLNVEGIDSILSLMRFCRVNTPIGDVVIMYSWHQDFNAMLVSSDEGTTWEQLSIQSGFANRRLQLLSVGGGRILGILGSPGIDSSYFVESMDGVSFDTVAMVTGNVDDAASDGHGRVWFVSDDTLRFYDATTQETGSVLPPAGEDIARLVVAGSRVCVLTYKKMLYVLGDDARTWVATNQPVLPQVLLMSLVNLLPGPDGSMVCTGWIHDTLTQVQYLPPGATEWSTITTIENFGGFSSGLALSDGRVVLSSIQSYGPFVSSTDRRTWTSVNTGLMSQPIYRTLIVDEENVLAATTSSNFYHRHGTDGPWALANPGKLFASGDGPVHGFTRLSDGIVLATTSQNGIYRSTTSGATWEALAPPAELEAWPRLRGEACRAGNILYVAGGNHVLQSGDQGLTWTVAAKTDDEISGGVATTPSGKVYVGTDRYVGEYAEGAITPLFSLDVRSEKILTSTNPDFVASIGSNNANGSRLLVTRSYDGHTATSVELDQRRLSHDVLLFNATVVPGNTILVTTGEGLVVVPATSAPSLVTSRVREQLVDIRYADGEMVATSAGGEVLRGTITVGVEEQARAGGRMAVVPNPVRGTAHVSVAPGVTSVTLVDHVGRNVMDLTNLVVGEECGFSTYGLVPGAYRIISTDGRTSTSASFIVVE